MNFRNPVKYQCSQYMRVHRSKYAKDYFEYDILPMIMVLSLMWPLLVIVIFVGVIEYIYNYHKKKEQN